MGPAWVLYDGECGLCDRAVGWLLARDRRAALRFAPLSGPTAAEVRRRHRELPAADESFLLVEDPGGRDERVLARSRAALAAVARLGGAWRAVRVLDLIPRPLGDAVYAWVARHRGRWFGRLAACRVPAPEERSRFLDLR